MKLLEVLLAIKGWVECFYLLIYCQYKSLELIVTDPSINNIKEGIASLVFWIPIDVMFIGIPLLLIYLIFKICKKYFKYVVK